MANWTDLSSAFGYGTKLTSSQQQQLRDNITAAFEKAGGAPVLANNYVVNAMMADNAIGQAEMANNAIGQAEMANNAIGQAELKTSTQSQSYDIPASSWHKFTLTGGQYCFRPTYKGEDVYQEVADTVALTTSYATVTKMNNTNASFPRFGYVLHRYITSSGEIYWIFIVRNKTTKKIIGVSACPDHPCFGSSQKPQLESHPFGDGYDPAKHEIIVINPSKEQVLEMKRKTIVESETEPDKDLTDVIKENYNLDETTEPDWPTEAVTVGLPPEWEELPMGSIIEPIKKVIPKPKYIKTAALKLKKE